MASHRGRKDRSGSFRKPPGVARSIPAVGHVSNGTPVVVAVPVVLAD